MNRAEIIEYIQNTFAVTGEKLWLKYPDYIVFRNANNKKWFAVIMDIDKSKLGLKGKGKVDIIDLKCESLLIGSLICNKGYLPAYHMNKNNWITALIDEDAHFDEIKDLIHLSYEIVDKKK